MNKRGLGLWLGVSGALVALCLTGCANQDDSSDGGSSNTASMGALAGLNFVATGVTQGGDPYALVPGSRISLSFTDTAMAADAGCNHMSGDASYADGMLTVAGAGLAMTEMGCDTPLMDQDTWLADLLSSTPTVTLDGDRLTLTSGDTVIDLVDRDTVEPDQPLVGTMWSLTAMGTAGADGSVSSIPAGVDSTLLIDDTGTAQLRPGCNNGRSSVDITDTTVTFAPIALTRMACPGAEGEVEAAVLAVIDGTVDYAIDGQQLTLTKDDNTLTYQLSEKVYQAD